MRTIDFNGKKIRVYDEANGAAFLALRDLSTALGYSSAKYLIRGARASGTATRKDGLICLNSTGIDSMIARAAKAPNNRKLDSWLVLKSALPVLLNTGASQPEPIASGCLDSLQRVREYVQRLESENRRLRTENEKLTRTTAEIKRFFSELA